MANADAPEGSVPGQPESGSPEKPRASIHDTYVYRVLGDPRLAAAEIKTVLAKEVADEIDWDKLELDPPRYVTENLNNQYTDLLFRTTIRGRPLRIRLLVEHSSHAKPIEPLQSLKYQVLEWEREEARQRESKTAQRLTPIITIIFHHSESGWRGRTQFSDYFGLDEDLVHLLRPYVVDFRIVLDDISKLDTEAFVRRPVPLEVKLFLFGLRYAREGRKFLQELPKIAHVISALCRDPNTTLATRVFFKYIKKVGKVREADLRDAFREYIEPYLDQELVAVWTDYEAGEKQGIIKGERRGIIKGERRGIIKGERRGIIKGERSGIIKGERRGIIKGERSGIIKGELKRARSTFERLLTHRFGPLTSAHLERLESASLEELEAMTLRVLTAASIEEVLGQG